MERGPVALFGAIVAVGLGPALWLGAQFGHFDVAPPGPAVPVDRTHEDTAQLMGGSGAGENQTGDDTPAVSTTPHAHLDPVATSPSVVRSNRPTDVKPSASASKSSEPSVSPSPSESTDPAGDGDGDGGSVPPSPPGPGDPSDSAAPGGTGAGIGGDSSDSQAIRQIQR